jgi:hypothetical protein
MIRPAPGLWRGSRAGLSLIVIYEDQEFNRKRLYYKVFRPARHVPRRIPQQPAGRAPQDRACQWVGRFFLSAARAKASHLAQQVGSGGRVRTQVSCAAMMGEVEGAAREARGAAAIRGEANARQSACDEKPSVQRPPRRRAQSMYAVQERGQALAVEASTAPWVEFSRLTYCDPESSGSSPMTVNWRGRAIGGAGA